MRVCQEQVELFMRRIDESAPETPELGDYIGAMRRRDFIQEELNEYERAVHNDDLIGIADALADLVYVVLGTAVHHGIDLQPIFEEVHQSNLTKDVGGEAHKGCVKGPGFQKPRIAELLLIQQTRL